MARCKSLSAFVCLLAVCALIAPAVYAGQIEFTVQQQGDEFIASFNGQVAGLAGAYMLRDGSVEWMEFETWDDGFGLDSDSFESLDELSAEIAGNYTLQINHADQISQYSFTIGAIQDSQMPACPIIGELPDELPQQYTFTWDWSGTADAKVIEFEGGEDEDYVQFEMFYSADIPGFTDVFYHADFQGFIGDAEAAIFYGNEVDNLIPNFSLRDGDVDVLGDGLTQYVVAFDSASFTVVPEPMTLGLIALGSLALIRRRK